MSGSIPPHVEERIAAHLNAIASEFKVGARLTLLVRNPSTSGDADAVFTNDSLQEAIAGLQRRNVGEVA